MDRSQKAHKINATADINTTQLCGARSAAGGRIGCPATGSAVTFSFVHGVESDGAVLRFTATDAAGITLNPGESIAIPAEMYGWQHLGVLLTAGTPQPLILSLLS